MEGENTYQKYDSTLRLEMYEWDGLWWEQTEEDQKPRVLYIGDSISGGIRGRAQNIADNEIMFDRIGTSKAVDNPYFMDLIRLFAAQQGKRDLIIFNNGLHGWHLSDTEEYGLYYEKMVRFLMSEYPDTPLLLVLTTKIDKERNQRVLL